MGEKECHDAPPLVVEEELGLKEETDETMPEYDEIVTIKDRDDNVIGSGRMIWRVTLSKSGQRSWMGDFRPIPGNSFDFDFASLEQARRVECQDGATGRILKPIIEDARSFGFRCWFEGVWPPPRVIA